MQDMWPESSSVNTEFGEKIYYNSGDIEFSLGDYFFWRALYIRPTSDHTVSETISVTACFVLATVPLTGLTVCCSK